MRRPGFKPIMVMITLLSIIVLTACSENTPAEQPAKETPVGVEKVTQGDFAMNVEIIAIAKPLSEVQLVPKVAGELTELMVNKGDSVEVGDVLAVIDDKNLRRAAELEQMSLELAHNQLSVATLQLSQVEDAIKSSLRDDNTSSKEATDRVRQAQLQVEQAQLSIKRSEVSLKQAEERLLDSTITPPISGEITNITAGVGEMVGQSALFTIAQISPIKFEASVGSDQLSLLQAGQTMGIDVPTIGGQVEGVVRFVSPVADPSGLYHVELEATNSDKRIKAGMGAKLLVPETLVQDTLLVPTQAIIERGDKSFVFIVRDGIAIEKEIQVVNSQSELSAVLGDMVDQDMIVVRGQLTLADGHKVRVIEEAQ